MTRYCYSCFHRLTSVGIAFEIYKMICDFYSLKKHPVKIYDPKISEAIHYLEINCYIVSLEVGNNTILVKPRTVALDDTDNFACCSGICECSEIELKPDTA